MFSSSGYSTLGSDRGVMTSSLTNSPFADARGNCVSLLNSHQPSFTGQWTARASAAEHYAGYTSSSQFPQVFIADFFIVSVLHLSVFRIFMMMMMMMMMIC